MRHNHFPVKVPILRIPFTGDDRRFLAEGLDRILDSGALTMGRNTAEFEERFAAFSGSKHAVACSNGTAAIELILRAIGLEDRDVVVPTNTFLATALAVVHSGNRVVFADSDPSTLCLDVDDVKRRVTETTAAVILVHVGGIITPRLHELQAFCRERGLYLIEDCAHAHGCTIDGRSAGTLGIAGAFSFFPTKVLTTGEGGIVTTDDERLARQMRILRNHGKNPELNGRMSELGQNLRMSELTALLGVRQLDRAAELIAERRNAAAFYDAQLTGLIGLRPFTLASNATTTYYKYPVHLEPGIDRDGLKRRLRETHGVTLPSEVYADMCHTEPVWTRYTYAGRRRHVPEDPPSDFPGADRISRHHICLPVYPGLTQAELAHVVGALGVELNREREAASCASS